MKSKFLIPGLVTATLVVLGTLALLNYFYITNSSRQIKVTRVPDSELANVDDRPAVLRAEGVGLPENFPENFPIYEGAKLTDSWTAEGGEKQGISVIWETEDLPDIVFEFYKEQLENSGWKTKTVLQSDDSFTLSFERRVIAGFIGVTFDSEATMTVISATIGIGE